MNNVYKNMSVNCDFCGEDISHLCEDDYLCTCGSKSCGNRCHEVVETEVTDGCYTNRICVCKDEVLQDGKRGMIVYDYYGECCYGKAITDDPDYEPMVKELRELRKQVNQLKEENNSLQVKNRDLRTQIECMPGGKEYLAAKERFEEQDY